MMRFKVWLILVMSFIVSCSEAQEISYVKRYKNGSFEICILEFNPEETPLTPLSTEKINDELIVSYTPSGLIYAIDRIQENRLLSTFFYNQDGLPIMLISYFYSAENVYMGKIAESYGYSFKESLSDKKYSIDISTNHPRDWNQSLTATYTGNIEKGNFNLVGVLVAEDNTEVLEMKYVQRVLDDSSIQQLTEFNTGSSSFSFQKKILQTNNRYETHIVDNRFGTNEIETKTIYIDGSNRVFQKINSVNGELIDEVISEEIYHLSKVNFEEENLKIVWSIFPNMLIHEEKSSDDSVLRLLVEPAMVGIRDTFSQGALSKLLFFSSGKVLTGMDNKNPVIDRDILIYTPIAEYDQSLILYTNISKSISP
jgi:hypothetical protein